MGDEQGQRGVAGAVPIVIFLDENHCRNPHVIRAVERMFYFSRNNLSGRAMGAAVAKAMKAIVEFATSQPAPFTASIGKNGDVHLRDTFQGQVTR